MSTPLRQATNPRQYDALRWEEEGLRNSPTRLHSHYYLEKYARSFLGQRVLDVGSGSGHLSRLLYGLGAQEVIGVEPSRRNVRMSHLHYPRLHVIPTTFEQAKLSGTFDTIVAIMSTEHIGNLPSAMAKWYRLLRPGGRLIIVSGSVLFHALPKLDRSVMRKHLADGSVVLGIARTIGTIYDIVRPVRLYLTAARQAGFHLRYNVPMTPSARLLKAQPKFRAYRGQAISRLFIFQRP